LTISKYIVKAASDSQLKAPPPPSLTFDAVAVMVTACEVVPPAPVQLNVNVVVAAMVTFNVPLTGSLPDH
jgi:hypothetical protein